MHRFIQIQLLIIFSMVPGAIHAVDGDLHYKLLSAENASKPEIRGNTIVWTYAAPHGTRYVSLAFEHENYSKLYTYNRNSQGIFVLNLLNPNIDKPLRYRIIVDGLWTIDPMAVQETDDRGIRVSRVDILQSSIMQKPGTRMLPNGKIQFVYKDKPGSNVTLIGDFNSWDPFLITMNESPAYPGIYSTVLLVSADYSYYRYVVDGREILDPANPLIARNPRGEKASLLPKY